MTDLETRRNLMALRWAMFDESPCLSCKHWKPLCYHPKTSHGWYPCYVLAWQYWEPREP